MLRDSIVPGLSWSWSYGSWIYNYLYNQCLSPLTLRVRISLRRGVLDTLCDKVCQLLAAGRWVTPGTLVSYTKKNDRHDVTEILLKVAINTINLNHNQVSYSGSCLHLIDYTFYFRAHIQRLFCHRNHFRA
jgi:hypothetical protein